RCLLGRTRGRTNLSSDDFDEDEFVRANVVSGVAMVACTYHALRAQLFLLHEDGASAVREALAAEARLPEVLGQFLATDLSFWLALALLLDRSVSPVERAARLAKVDEHIGMLATLSERCPENYERKWLLVSA